MKALLFVLLCGSYAQAGTAWLTLKEQGGHSDVNEFRMTWSLDGNVTYQTVFLGNPIPVETDVNGLRTWKMDISNSLWVPKQQVCFMAKALKDGAKIGQSNLACKIMPEAPNQPVIIGVTVP